MIAGGTLRIKSPKETTHARRQVRKTMMTPPRKSLARIRGRLVGSPVLPVVRLLPASVRARAPVDPCGDFLPRGTWHTWELPSRLRRALEKPGRCGSLHRPVLPRYSDRHSKQTTSGKGHQVTFNTDGKCPICGKAFRSDACPHSLSQVEDRLKDDALDKRIREVVRDEVANHEVRSHGDHPVSH